MAFVASFPAEERDRYIGYIEAAGGMGMLFGPMIGAALFDQGERNQEICDLIITPLNNGENVCGFVLPFVFFGGVYICLYPLFSSALCRSIRYAMAKEPKEKKDPQASSFNVWPLFMNRRFIFVLISQMILMMAIQYLAPNMALHLQSFDYSPSEIGLCYAIPAVLYASTCPFVYLLTSRMKKRGVVMIGLLLITISMVLVGGSSFFSFQR